MHCSVASPRSRVRTRNGRPEKLIPLRDRILFVQPQIRIDAYTPSQVSAVTGLPLPAVHKAIEHKLIRPRRVRQGRAVQRLLTRAQVLYLAVEAKGLRSLPLATRRLVARAVERNPAMEAMRISEGGIVLIELKAARKEVERALRRLAEAERMVVSDPEVMQGAPVYRGTRIPVHAIADMLSQGARVDEILEGYPALTREKIELAPLYVKAYPRRGRPAARPWAHRASGRVTGQRLASGATSG